MFAVPGWAVAPSALKTQVATDITSESKRALKKRKRQQAHDASDASPSVNSTGPKESQDLATKGHPQTTKQRQSTDSIIQDRNQTGDSTTKKKAKLSSGSSQSKASANHTSTSKQAEDPKKSSHVVGDLSNASPRPKKQKRKHQGTVDGEAETKTPQALSHPDLNESKLPEVSGRASGGSLEPQSAPSEVSQPVSQKPQAAINGSTANLTPLQATMKDKLISSRFRYLNETLYTVPSSRAQEMFAQNPSFFREYHEGFRRQVTAWPGSPLDGFVDWIQLRGRIKSPHKGQRGGKEKSHHHSDVDDDTISAHQNPMLQPLPRDVRSGRCVIADLGCGDGRLAQILTTAKESKAPLTRALRLDIKSYDLAAPSPLITVADIRTLPLPDQSVDVAIFCLALMGTNWIDFLEEAYRVLRWHGECWIAEVNSRFVSAQSLKQGEAKTPSKRQAKILARNREAAAQNPSARDLLEPVDDAAQTRQRATDVSGFVDVCRRRGFELVGQPDLENKMFVRLRFIKSLVPSRGKGQPPQGQGSVKKGKSFIDREAVELSVEAEARALKPCVYKTR